MSAMSSTFNPGSSTAVSPERRHSANARAQAFCFASTEGAGGLMRSIASSTNTPVGSPRASRMISPPGGGRVAPVIFMRVIARVFASNACPSARSSTTGFARVCALSA